MKLDEAIKVLKEDNQYLTAKFKSELREVILRRPQIPSQDVEEDEEEDWEDEQDLERRY